MDFLYLLAADPQAAVVSDGIFKYVCAGMGTGMAGMGYAILTLYKDVKAAPDKIKEAEGVIREKYDAVIREIREKHKEELKTANAEKERHRREKDQLLREQLNDAKDEVKSFSEQADGFNSLLEDDLVPVMQESVEVLNYCKQAIERNEARRKKTS